MIKKIKNARIPLARNTGRAVLKLLYLFTSSARRSLRCFSAMRVLRCLRRLSTMRLAIKHRKHPSTDQPSDGEWDVISHAQTVASSSVIMAETHAIIRHKRKSFVPDTLRIVPLDYIIRFPKTSQNTIIMIPKRNEVSR